MIDSGVAGQRLVGTPSQLWRKVDDEDWDCTGILGENSDTKEQKVMSNTLYEIWWL